MFLYVSIGLLLTFYTLTTDEGRNTISDPLLVSESDSSDLMELIFLWNTFDSAAGILIVSRRGMGYGGRDFTS